MKKGYSISVNYQLLAFAFIFFFASCNKQESSLDSISEVVSASISKRSCAMEEVLQQQLSEDPSLASRMQQIESFTQKFIARKKSDHVLMGAKPSSGTTGGTSTTGIQIPVVINLLYNTAEQNISDAQIQSQIDVLNEDFNQKNADNALVPSLFQSVNASVGIRFVLSKVMRKSTRTTSFTTDDAMKSEIKPTDPSNYLNIWVCNMSGGVLGYAQLPGGNPSTDGVVVHYKAFGRTGTLLTNFDKGRTATHEIGHWMNLRHIWGSGTCGDDFVADTPQHDSPNYGCPGFPTVSTCAGQQTEMTMNFLDYSNDACMYMFTVEQKNRMHAVFAPGGPRESIVK